VRLARALALAAALGLPAPAADTLCLKDGRIFDGVVLRRGEGAILVQFRNGEVAVPLERVLECVIENDSGFVPRTEEEERMVAEGLVLFQEKWVKPSERAARLKKLVAEQRAAVEKLAQSRLWRNRGITDTKTFSVEYTVPPPVFTDMSELMEAYYAEFVKRWRIKKPRDLGKLKVRFYAEPDDFYQVTGVPRGVLAFFEYAEPPYRLQFYYDRLDPVGVERDMLHEFGHYLQALIEPGFHYPHWPGESLAEYFSTATFDRATKKITIEPLVLEERLIEIHRDIEEGERVGLEDLIRRGNDGNYHDYTWGWSLIHFLMSKPETAKRFESFYIGLARSRSVAREGYSALKSLRIERVEGEEMLASFKKEMGLKKEADVRALEVAWHDYVQHDIAVTSSRGLARAAQKSRAHGRQHRAKRLYEEAIAAGDADALTHHRYAELLAGLDEKKASHEQWAKAVALDPLEAEFYIAWGESLLEDTATKDQGKRLLLLAHEIAPDNLYLEQNLGDLMAK
jgi:hypothetical protein